MTLFLLLAVGMVLLALGLVIVPVLRRLPMSGAQIDASRTVLADRARELERERAAGSLGETEYEQARRELERQALELQAPAGGDGRGSAQTSWGAALAMSMVLPVLVLLVYTGVGEPAAVLQQPLLVQASPTSDGHASDDAAIAALSQRLAQDDSDAEGWVLLARSYFQLQRMTEALDAYARASELVPDSADLLVEYANTQAMAHERDLSGGPEQLVARALAIDPDNLNALAFAGLAAFQGDDHALALRHWRRLESLTPAGSEDRARVGALIARAGGESVPTQMVTRTVAVRAEIRGTVVVDPALASQVAGSDTLFIFARAAAGPPMPLAAVRTRAGSWPVVFTLDDSSAMAEELALSRFDRVNVVARVSRLGNPSAQPGDIEGSIENVAVGSGDVRLVLDRVVGR